MNWPLEHDCGPKQLSAVSIGKLLDIVREIQPELLNRMTAQAIQSSVAGLLSELALDCHLPAMEKRSLPVMSKAGPVETLIDAFLSIEPRLREELELAQLSLYAGTFMQTIYAAAGLPYHPNCANRTTANHNQRIV